MPDLDADCYLGVNFIRAYKAVLDRCKNGLYIKDARVSPDLDVAGVTQLKVLSLASVGLADVTRTKREQLQALLDRLLENSQAPLDCTDWAEHKIDVDDARPIKQRYYPVSKKIEDEMYSQVQEMLEVGVIEPFSNTWSSPIAMIRKANGKYRFCVDFPKLMRSPWRILIYYLTWIALCANYSAQNI